MSWDFVKGEQVDGEGKFQVDYSVGVDIELPLPLYVLCYKLGGNNFRTDSKLMLGFCV